MKLSATFAPALAACALLTGCVGSGPSTQRGAVTGGALGAIAGAVIGHNSRGGNTLGGALIGGYAGAAAGGTLGNAEDHENGTIYGQQRRRPRYVDSPETIPQPPPPAPAAAQETIPSAPAPNAVWIPGYWDYTGSAYAWLPGHWELPPAGATSYVAAHWENRGCATVYVQSYWR